MAVNRPNRESPEKEIWEYIEYLEDKLSDYSRNGAISFMGSLNRKLMVLAEQIDNADIQFGSKDDKLYDRFIATAKVGKDLASDFKAFLLEYGEVVQEDETKKNRNLMELHAKNKQK